MITYRVCKEERYFVVRSKDNGLTGSNEELGHYTDRLIATEVAYALAEQERKRLGYTLGDPRLQFPAPLDACINGCDGLQSACSECPSQSLPPESEVDEVETVFESNFSVSAAELQAAYQAPNGSDQQD